MYMSISLCIYPKIENYSLLYSLTRFGRRQWNLQPTISWDMSEDVVGHDIMCEGQGCQKKCDKDTPVTVLCFLSLANENQV